MKVASGLSLLVTDATVLQNSNKLALRLLPCKVVARVSFAGSEEFRAELEIGRRFAEVDAPALALSPACNRSFISAADSR
jgi:hypothetical protein